MFRLRTDEDVHVDVIDGGVVRVRRMTKRELRWEHAIDLTHLYADRLAQPTAEVIDGWFGAGGELRLIVHARDTAHPRLLPPRELTFSADGPLLERSRPGADRKTLASLPIRSHPWGGTMLRLVQELDDHVLCVIDADEARRIGWSVADLPDIGFRWFERSELGNLPPFAPGDPCALCGALPMFGTEDVRGMNLVEVDRERGQSRRIVECHRCLMSWDIDEVVEQGTMQQLWKWSRLGIRDRAGEIAPIVDPTPTIAVPPAPPRPLVSATLVPGHVIVDGCDVDDGFEVFEEYPDSLTLCRDAEPSPRPDLVAAGFEERHVEFRSCYVYLQTYDKNDPRLGGFLGYVEHAGYRLRATERRAGKVHVVACRFIADLVGLPKDEVTASGWVPDPGDAPVRPPIDEGVVYRLKPHMRVMYAPIARLLGVHRESAEAMTLHEHSGSGELEDLVKAGFRVEFSTTQDRYDQYPNYDHYLEVPKLDGRIAGPFSRWVRYRGSVVRVLEERDGHVLAIAESGLGRTLDFADVRPGGDHIYIACRWIPVSEIQTLAV